MVWKNPVTDITSKPFLKLSLYKLSDIFHIKDRKPEKAFTIYRIPSS